MVAFRFLQPWPLTLVFDSPRCVASFVTIGIEQMDSKGKSNRWLHQLLVLQVAIAKTRNRTFASWTSHSANSWAPLWALLAASIGLLHGTGTRSRNSKLYCQPFRQPLVATCLNVDCRTQDKNWKTNKHMGRANPHV